MDNLRRMDDERIGKLELDISILNERVSNWMESTTSYREQLCSKLDKIQNKIECLPCPSRIEQTKSLFRDIGWLQKIVYTILCYSIPALIGLAVAWGSMSKDVIHLKEISYGARGIEVLTKKDFQQYKKDSISTEQSFNSKRETNV